MPAPKPQEFPRYSLHQFDKAGRRFKDRPPVGAPKAEMQEWIDTIPIVSNWRAAHGFPLQRIREWVRRKATKVDPKANVAQRLKRILSIHNKLSRSSRSWRLTQLQDIAGCRAVVRSIPALQVLRHRLSTAKIQHRHG